jgi:hypothetical protein
MKSVKKIWTDFGVLIHLIQKQWIKRLNLMRKNQSSNQMNPVKQFRSNLKSSNNLQGRQEDLLKNILLNLKKMN